MFERFDDDVRHRLLQRAAQEARRRGDSRIGTEHLLLGLLVGATLTARVLDVDLRSARGALEELDRRALAAVGVDLFQLPAPVPVFTRRRPRFTSGAGEALHHAVIEARSEGARRVTERHALIGLLARRRPDPAAELLAALGVDPAAARRRLRQLAA